MNAWQEMKSARRGFIIAVASLLLALVFTLPWRGQLLAAAAGGWFIAHLAFRRSLSRREIPPAWSSLALPLSATIAVLLSVAGAALLLVQSYQFISRRIKDPYAMHVTWLAYAVLAVIAWLLFNPRKKEPHQLPGPTR